MTARSFNVCPNGLVTHVRSVLFTAVIAFDCSGTFFAEMCFGQTAETQPSSPRPLTSFFPVNKRRALRNGVLC